MELSDNHNQSLDRAIALVDAATDAGILEGITRQAVIDLAQEAGMEVREPTIKLDDVYQADECFLTGSAAEVVPVVQVDDCQIGTGTPGPVTCDLMKRFRELVNPASE